MKKTFKLFAVLFIFVLAVSTSMAQTPTYSLCADSLRLVTVTAPDDAVEFGVYLTHTNAATPFNLAGTQLFFSFNSGILNGCVITDTVNCVKLRIIGSQLPIPYQPRNPSVSDATNPTATVLRMAINAFQGAPGLSITGATNLLVAKVRLTNLAPPGDRTFDLEALTLSWRNPPTVAFATKVFAYINNVNTDITTPLTHCIDSLGLPNPLPVEMASFSSAVNRNNVNLN